jgi:hypothetical protein
VLRDRLAHIVSRPEVQGALSIASPDRLDAHRQRSGLDTREVWLGGPEADVVVASGS